MHNVRQFAGTTQAESFPRFRVSVRFFADAICHPVTDPGQNDPDGECCLNANRTRLPSAGPLRRIPASDEVPPEATLVDELQASDAWIPGLSLVGRDREVVGLGGGASPRASANRPSPGSDQTPDTADSASSRRSVTERAAGSELGTITSRSRASIGNGVRSPGSFVTRHHSRRGKP